MLSPRGTCEDCYRTWESLLLGSIPIIKSSFLDRLFTDLPVLIVKEWEEITEEFLQNQYLEIQSKTYKKEKIFIDYWLKKLLHYQKLVVKDQEFSFSYD